METPQTEGNYNFTLGLTDSGTPRLSTTQAETVVITQGIQMSCAPPGNATVGVAFSLTCTITSNEVPPFYWGLLSGSPPPGVVFPYTQTGTQLTISGTPTAAGPFQMTIDAGKNLPSGPPLLTQTVVSGTVVAPTLTASPTSISFLASAGASSPPPARIVSVLGTPAGASFTVKVPSNQPWLSAAIVTGQIPGSISISVNPSTLAAGQTYSGQVIVSGPDQTQAVINISLEFDLSTPATMSVAPDHLTFATVASGAAIASSVAVNNLGGGMVNYTATAADAWVVLAGNSGSATSAAPARQAFTINPAGLGAGTYHSSIQFQNSDGSLVTVPVTLAVNALSQSIGLVPAALTFTTARLASTGLAVTDTGLGSMSWQATPLTLAGGSWLSVNPSSGSASAIPSAANVNVDPAGLMPGTYYGAAQVTSTNAGDSPQSVSVLMNVIDALFQGEPVVSPQGVLLVNSPVTVTLTTLGSGQATFMAKPSTTDGTNWLGVSPASGTIGAYTTSAVQLEVNSAGLAPGLRTGSVRFTFGDGNQSVVSVTMLVPNLTAGACQPGSLVPVITNLPSGFEISAGLPVNLQVTLLNDCGAPVTSGDVSAAFNDGDGPLALSPTPGGWTGTWVPRNSGSVTISIRAYAGTLSGSSQINGAVDAADPSAPAFTANVVNSASYLWPDIVAPGSWISVLGDRMATAAALNSAAPFPTSLSGTQVLLGNSPLPLIYVGPGQINAQVPNGIAPNSAQTLLIQRGSTFSVPRQIIVADALPAIYTTNSQGTGQGAILIASTGLLAAPSGMFPGSRPVAAGEYLSVYCSGLGALSNAPADGEPAPSTPPFAVTISTPVVTVGGVNATLVSYSGLAPGLVGLYQVNVQLPAGAPSGSAVPVQIQVGNTVSNTVTIAVQ
jgi:trimeric autotransporter adhesin